MLNCFKRVPACTFAAIAIGILGSCSSAFGAAGAPDSTFGVRGITELGMAAPSETTRTYTGRGVLLPDGGVVVPRFRSEFRLTRTDTVQVTRFTVRLTWVRPDGTIARTSPAVALPVDLSDPRLERTADGHLLVIGARYRAPETATSLYVLRLSPEGIQETAPGGSAPAVSVTFATIPNVGSGHGRMEIGAVSVAPSGRVLVALRHTRTVKASGETTGYGNLVVAAIDPSVGLAPSFASGGLIIAPESDTRTTASVAIAADSLGRVAVALRSTKSGVGGTSQQAHLSRYDSAGALDPTFAGGRIELAGATIDKAYNGTPSLMIGRDGDVIMRIDVTAEAANRRASGVELRRYTSAGQVAPGFGIAGIATIVLQRSRAYGSSYYPSYGSGFSEPAPLAEQPDGKLLVGMSQSDFSSRLVPRDGILRTTASGLRDSTYGNNGFARFDAPWSGSVSSTMIGTDSSGRAVASIGGYTSGGYSRVGVARLLAGDSAAPPTTVRLGIDNRAGCGTSMKRACFDPDGAVRITGQVIAGGRGVVGADVVLDIVRPDSYPTYEDGAVPNPVRSGKGGRFVIVLPKGRMLPGAWAASARVLATSRSQRVDRSAPVHFVLGPRADIATLRTLHRSQALAIAMDYIVDESITYGSSGQALRQCTTAATCFRPSAQLRGLVSATAHPAPGKAGLVVRRPGNYTIVTRARTPFRLEFVITQTADDTIYSCRGDLVARRRWCQGGTWDDVFQDAFVTAGVDGAPFDY